MAQLPRLREGPGVPKPACPRTIYPEESALNTCQPLPPGPTPSPSPTPAPPAQDGPRSGGEALTQREAPTNVWRGGAGDFLEKPAFSLHRWENWILSSRGTCLSSAWPVPDIVQAPGSPQEAGQTEPLPSWQSPPSLRIRSREGYNSQGPSRAADGSARASGGCGDAACGGSQVIPGQD